MTGPVGCKTNLTYFWSLFIVILHDSHQRSLRKIDRISIILEMMGL